MGCAASTLAVSANSSGSSGVGSKLKTSDSESEGYSEHSTVRQFDFAAIEELSHVKGEQSLLALAMSGTLDSVNAADTLARRTDEAERGCQTRTSHSSLSRHEDVSEADSRLLPAATTATSSTVTSPVKIRIQETHSSAITAEEHEHSKHLPDVQYSMRSAAAMNPKQRFELAGAAELNHFGAGGGVGGVAANTQPYNAARKLQPLANVVIGPVHQLGSQPTVAAPHHIPVQPQLQYVQPLIHGPIPVLGATGASGGDRLLHPVGRGAGRGGPYGMLNAPVHRGGPVGPLTGGAVSPGLAIGAGRGVGVGGPQRIPRPLRGMATGGSVDSQRDPGLVRAVDTANSQYVPAKRFSLQPRPFQAPSPPVSPVKKSSYRSSVKPSGSDDDDDDDDELVGDDDEVEDWDLGEEAGGGGGKLAQDSRGPDATLTSIPVTQQNRSLVPLPNSAPPVMKQLPPKPIQTTTVLAATPTQRVAKFRPMFDNVGDIGAIVSTSQVESGSDSDDDKDDSDFGGNDDSDDVGDWFEEDSKAKVTAHASSSANSSLAFSKKQLPSREIAERTGASPHARSPAASPALSPVRGSAATSPTHRHAAPGGAETAKTSPHPPPMQRAHSRQFSASTGSTSPTRAAPGVGLPAPVGSPTKQVSYRTNIVGVGSQVLIPLAASAALPGNDMDVTATAAPIRDTKVVKKKRAELPQRNLPHPTPKFGDWLNSRTMINNYIILEPLGSGSYAEVKLCKEKVSGKLFAMKFINRDIMKKDKLGKQSKLDDIKREIAIMKKLHHPNVLRLYEVMDDPTMNKLFLVLEYMKHGDLLSHQKKKHAAGGADTESLHDRDLHCVFLQVVLGLAYLHEQKIVHGDIKPQNILVGDKDAVKIADFGISQSLYGSKQKLSDTAGTPAFMSPEMCSGEAYSGQLADVWAVGATIFMLKFGSPPFVAKSALQMFEKIQSDPLVFPFAIDPLLRDLLTGMMVKDPQKRLALVDVMAHPWVTKEETLSSYTSLSRQDAPRITVSNDEIEHAIHSNDQFAVIVNIRIQMMKRLQRARQEVLERQRDASDTGASVGAVARIAVATERATPPTIDALPLVSCMDKDITIRSGGTATASGDGEEQSRSVVQVRSPKVRQNKVHADHDHRQPRHEHQSSASTVSSSGGDDDRNSSHDHDMLSVAESNLRSQMFSRKKTGTSTAPSSKPRELEACSVDGSSGASDDDSDDDRDRTTDVLSSDDDDEAAFAQSPQLLDELLLTTLSLPPLSKTAALSNVAQPHQVSSFGHTGVGHSRGSRPSSPVGPSSLADSRESYYGDSPTLALRFAVASLQGRRSTQEDRWVVLPEIGSTAAASTWASSAFVGIYDGHGGEACATILHEQLHAWIFRDPHTGFELSPAALQASFEELDANVCDYLLQQGDLSGSTATCVVLSPSRNEHGRSTVRAVVAHVGDCRLVLSSRDGSTRDVTRDHRASDSAECARIVTRGGRVVNSRVNGVLAITRAFGDLEFKGRLHAHSVSTTTLVMRGDEPSRDTLVPALLSATPDVVMLELDAHEHDFFLLACDGLWDVMASSEAAALVRERLELHGDLSLAARELAQEAIRRYSNDNITVVVVQLASATTS